jgi:hypothetical protein
MARQESYGWLVMSGLRALADRLVRCDDSGCNRDTARFLPALL